MIWGAVIGGCALAILMGCLWLYRAVKWDGVVEAELKQERDNAEAARRIAAAEANAARSRDDAIAELRSGKRKL